MPLMIWNENDALAQFCDGALAPIGAICISPEAAVHEVIRAPFRLNKKREHAGKLPILDHHTISLARRQRATPSPFEPGERRSPRLHWRRGHWRHFDNTRTWIKWMLVGDPDLGFVDKYYRL